MMNIGITLQYIMQACSHVMFDLSMLDRSIYIAKNIKIKVIYILHSINKSPGRVYIFKKEEKKKKKKKIEGKTKLRTMLYITMDKI